MSALRDLVRQARGESSVGHVRPQLASRFAPSAVDASARVEESVAPAADRIAAGADSPATPSHTLQPGAPLIEPPERVIHAAPRNDAQAPHSAAPQLVPTRAETPLPYGAARFDAIAAALSVDAARAAPAQIGNPISAPAPPEPSMDVGPVRPATAARHVASAPTAPRGQARTPGTRATAFETPAPAPEVHIHIGRVELTALAAAPKTPRRSEQKPALSLDEYLRQRNAPRGGRP